MAYKRNSPIPVIEGGTGAKTLGLNGVLIGNTLGAISSTVAGTTGQVLTGITGSAPIFQAPSGGGDVSGPVSSTNTAIATWNGTTGTALFDNATTAITSTGIMTNTGQPAFYAYLSASQTNVTGAGADYKVPFNTVLFDQNSNFNTGTSVFTAPSTGIYSFTVVHYLQSVTTANTSGYAYLKINASLYYVFDMNVGAVADIINGGNLFLPSNTIINLTAADTVEVHIVVLNGVSNTVGVSGSSNGYTFAGYLIA